LSHGGAGLDSFYHYASHLQKLMKHGFMSAAELKACRLPKDHELPAPAEGYVVSFTALHEQGFDVPLHPFLHSLLWYYDLELHHLTPFGVLHIAVFVTRCEAYLGLTPISICGSIPSVCTVHWIQKRSRQSQEAWSSMSSQGMGWIHTLRSPCPGR
jgi:hypothetical protein